MFGVAETKRRFAEILDRVIEGEHVIVTRRNKPVAVLVPHPVGGDAGAGVPPGEERPVGLAAFTAAMAGWDQFDEVVAAALTTRSVARDRLVPELG